MGYYTKNNKRGGNVVSGINNAVTLFQFIFCILFIGIIFIILKTIKDEKLINSTVNRRVLFGEELPSPEDNQEFTVAVARQIEEWGQEIKQLGEEIKQEPVIMNPVNREIFYDAELPPEEDNTSFMVAAYRPLDDLKKGAVNLFRKKK